MAQAEQQYVQTQAPARVFTEFLYATQDSWSRPRRVIAKAEHLDKGANPRFVVTSLSTEQMAAQELYEKGYCARGDCPENRMRRVALAGTELAQAQCGTIRLKLLKIGAQVRVTVRKIWISLNGGYPHAALFARVLAALEAGNAVT